MDVVVLPVEFLERRLEIFADPGEILSERIQDPPRESPATILQDEDQMDMQGKDAMPPSAIFLLLSHRPMLA